MRQASTTRGQSASRGTVVCNKWDECSSDAGAEHEMYHDKSSFCPSQELIVGPGPNNKSAVLLSGCPECDLPNGESWP